MTEADVIAHWRKGAQDALKAAQLLHDGRQYALGLFDVHLAVEKALKVVFMNEKATDPPATHNLVFLARQLQRSWTEDDIRKLEYLTQYAIAARYDDPMWAEHEATEENSKKWIGIADTFISSLLS